MKWATLALGTALQEVGTACDWVPLWVPLDPSEPFLEPISTHLPWLNHREPATFCLLAMQKVEGSSPFIRLIERPPKRGLFVVGMAVGGRGGSALSRRRDHRPGSDRARDRAARGQR